MSVAIPTTDQMERYSGSCSVWNILMNARQWEVFMLWVDVFYTFNENKDSSSPLLCNKKLLA